MNLPDLPGMRSAKNFKLIFRSNLVQFTIKFRFIGLWIGRLSYRGLRSARSLIPPALYVRIDRLIVLVLLPEQLGKQRLGLSNNPVDGRVESLIDDVLNLLDHSQNFAGDIAETEKAGEEADSQRKKPCKTALNLCGSAIDLTIGDVHN